MVAVCYILLNGFLLDKLFDINMLSNLTNIGKIHAVLSFIGSNSPLFYCAWKEGGFDRITHRFPGG